MNATFSYSSYRWRAARRKALARDQHRCSVSRLLGGECSSGPLNVHHLEPVREGGAPYDLDNLLTCCSRHHTTLDALRRTLFNRREPKPVRCPHTHRSAEARRSCEARLARERGLLVA